MSGWLPSTGLVPSELRPCTDGSAALRSSVCFQVVFQPCCRWSATHCCFVFVQRQLRAACAAESCPLRPDILLLKLQLLVHFFCLFLARGHLRFGCIVASQPKQEGGRRDGRLFGSH